MKKLLVMALSSVLAIPAFASTITAPAESDCKMINDTTLGFVINPATVSNQPKADEIRRLIQNGRSSGVSECQIMEQVKAASTH
jgi:hypothetical protein